MRTCLSSRLGMPNRNMPLGVCHSTTRIKRLEFTSAERLEVNEPSSKLNVELPYFSQSWILLCTRLATYLFKGFHQGHNNASTSSPSRSHRLCNRVSASSTSIIQPPLSLGLSSRTALYLYKLARSLPALAGRFIRTT